MKYQKVTKIEIRDRTIKTMNKCAQMKWFHHDLRLQVYMYDFMYVDPETMPVEAYFPATKTFIENYNKMSTTRRVSKHYLGFSFIWSYYH